MVSSGFQDSKTTWNAFTARENVTTPQLASLHGLPPNWPKSAIKLGKKNAKRTNGTYFFRFPFFNPSGVRGFCSRKWKSWGYSWEKILCWKPLSLNLCQTVCTRSENTSEPPPTHPNHVRTTSEPRPNQIRTTSKPHPKKWQKLREKWFLARFWKRKVLWGSDLFTRMLCTFCPPTILGDFYRFPEKSPRIVGGQNVQSMRVKRSDPQKDWNFTFSRIF